MKIARYAVQYSILVFAFYGVLHINLGAYYRRYTGKPLPGKGLANYSVGLGLGPRWRMYSPVPREIHPLPAPQWITVLNWLRATRIVTSR